MAVIFDQHILETRRRARLLERAGREFHTGFQHALKSSFNPDPATLDYTPTPGQRAGLQTLSGPLIDVQFYAASHDFRLDPVSGLIESGYHVLRFAPDLRIDALATRPPVAYAFMPINHFESGFDIIERGNDRGLKDFFCKAAGLGVVVGTPAIALRRVKLAEMVLTPGLYDDTLPSLSFQVRAGQILITHAGDDSFPEILTTGEAYARLRSGDPENDPRLIPALAP